MLLFLYFLTLFFILGKDFSSFNIKDLYNKVAGLEALQPDYVPPSEPILSNCLAVYPPKKGKVITYDVAIPKIKYPKIVHLKKKRKSLTFTNKASSFKIVEVVEMMKGSSNGLR